MSIDLSVIIVNYNTFSITSNCISSIYKETLLTNFEIIIVDNNSSERDPKDFKKKFPKIKLIQNRKNVGFGIANNQAMQIAEGKFFLLLNSDTYVLNQAIDKAFEYAKSNPDFSIFGASILNSDLTSQKSFFDYSTIKLNTAIRHGFILTNPILAKYFKSRSDSSKIGGLYGAYIFLRKEVFESTGGFDPDFFMYCEDTEWFRNRIKNKFKIAICEDSKIVHLLGKSSKSNLVNKQNVLSYFLYWYKLGKTYFFFYTIGAYLNSILTFFLLPLMSKVERKRHFCLIKVRFELFWQVFFDITKYNNSYNSRPSSLKAK